jgi:hypothetical protein
LSTNKTYKKHQNKERVCIKKNEEPESKGSSKSVLSCNEVKKIKIEEETSSKNSFLDNNISILKDISK